MVENREYIDTLQKIIACISHGDYFSVKELSRIKLEEINKANKKTEKDIKKNKNIKNIIKKNSEEWEKRDIEILMQEYYNYLFNKIEQSKNIEELKAELVSIQEFIEKLQKKI